MEAGLNESPAPKRGNAYIKAIVFVAFIVGAIVMVKITPVKEYLTAEQLGRFLDTAGIWAPVVFMAIYAAGRLPVSSRHTAYRAWGSHLRRLLGLHICLVRRHGRCKRSLYDRAYTG